MVDTKIRIKDHQFQNPIFVASGTFGYGLETSELMDVNKLGCVITKSVTLHPREGNPAPRIVETPSGMLNSIGLANVGVEKFIDEILPVYDDFKTPVILNIAGSSVDEYVKVLEKVEKSDDVLGGYEINVSCPNVDKGRMEFGVDCEMTSKLMKELRQRTDKLLIMKLSPNVTDIVEIAKAAEDEGVDALSAINTVVGMSINPWTFKPKISKKFGGLSGPAIKPVAIASVYKVSQNVSIPIIGIGGILTGDDAVEFMLAGAVSVQVGTANFLEPSKGLSILNELVAFCEKKNIDKVSSLTGGIING
tara:strand:- start:12839 stop:13756 length:918 start_codon:yes stop_codon:yes gene_type:complete